MGWKHPSLYCMEDVATMNEYAKEPVTNFKVLIEVQDRLRLARVKLTIRLSDAQESMFEQDGDVCEGDCERNRDWSVWYAEQDFTG